MRKPASTILGSWGMTTVYCGNHEGDLKPFELREERKQMIYACPDYDDPDCPCHNMLNVNDFQRMLDHLSNIIVESAMSDCNVNMTNYSWKDRNGIKFKILEHKPGSLKISVVNTRAIKRNM